MGDDAAVLHFDGHAFAQGHVQGVGFRRVAGGGDVHREGQVGFEAVGGGTGAPQPHFFLHREHEYTRWGLGCSASSRSTCTSTAQPDAVVQDLPITRCSPARSTSMPEAGGVADLNAPGGFFPDAAPMSTNSLSKVMSLGLSTFSTPTAPTVPLVNRTRCPSSMVGETPPMGRMRMKPSSSMWMAMTPISSMWAASMMRRVPAAALGRVAGSRPGR